jgi:dUTP pyrophosphatase
MFHPFTIKFECADAKEPTRASLYSAGLDIYSSKDEVILPGRTEFIRTGLRFILPALTYVQLKDTSALAAEGVFVRAGVVDSDFEAEIKVLLHNSTTNTYLVEKHSRIAQAVIQPYMPAEFNLINSVNQLIPTTPITQHRRGTLGYGQLDRCRESLARLHICGHGNPANQARNSARPAANGLDG